MGIHSPNKPPYYNPTDYYYDPVYSVSGPKDHIRAELLAKKSAIKYTYLPVFDNMFSEISHYPNKQIARVRTVPPLMLRKNLNIPECAVDDQGHTKEIDVSGADRYRFFKTPTKPALNLSKVYNLQTVAGETLPKINVGTSADGEKLMQTTTTASKKIQTQYRESSAQTTPWQPPYEVMQSGDPELLKLDFLKWGAGLPADLHVIDIIQRFRKKEAWKQYFDVEGGLDLEKHRDKIEAMEREQWAFREREIQYLHDMRLELLERMLGELHTHAQCISEGKLMNFRELKNDELQTKLRKLREKTNRELRKIDMKQSGLNKSYRRVDIVVEHTDLTSDLYGPQMRFGVHPKRRHAQFDATLKNYTENYKGAEDYDTLPSWLRMSEKRSKGTSGGRSGSETTGATLIDSGRAEKCRCVKIPGTRLCIRETKWTVPILRKLHQELKDLNKSKTSSKSCSLKIRADILDQTEVSESGTAEVEGIADYGETFYQAVILVQSIIRGRATQNIIYEGRDRCRQLINELRYSTGLMDSQNRDMLIEKENARLEKREESRQIHEMLRVQEYINHLQGTVVGSLLDFLNKELLRLAEQRRLHSICLLLERVRYDREAAEAGRRQKELRRRREHDEMFKQIVKVTQDTVDVYLANIVKESLQLATNADAEAFIERLAEKVDQEAHMTLPDMENVRGETETVGNLIHHFLLPEVRREIVRERIRKGQEVHLRNIHNELYDELEICNQ